MNIFAKGRTYNNFDRSKLGVVCSAFCAVIVQWSILMLYCINRGDLKSTLFERVAIVTLSHVCVCPFAN